MKKTATAIICNNKRLLFLQRDDIPTIPDPGKWQFPGGHIESGESPEETIRRELKEEVCFAPSSLTYVGAVKLVFRETHVFWGYVNENEVKKFRLGGDEGQEMKFMPVSEALSHDLTKGVSFYLTNFRQLLTNHLRMGTIPKASELGSVSWIKLLYFELFGYAHR